MVKAIIAWMSIMVLLAGCTTTVAVIETAEAGIEEHANPAETAGQSLSTVSMERAVSRVKADFDIKKQFRWEDSHSIVSAVFTEDGRLFAVEYDVEHSSVIREADGTLTALAVSFTVTETASGRTQSAALLWPIEDLRADDKSGILLAFDDAYMEIWETYFELFAAYEARVTFFVQGALTDFCAQALEHGHDIGYHTIQHLNLPKVSRDEFFTETLSDVDSFRSTGIPLRSFAYPYGLSEDWMHDELSAHFSIQRGYGVTARLYRPEDIQRGYITSKAIDNLLFRTDEDFEFMLDSVLRTVKFMGGTWVLPLTTHTISESADWGISPQRLERLLCKVKELKLQWYRYSDFAVERGS
ncbi:polysaccharide deacetylase family protein [Breznakiellaceae bacterium SP9]